MRIIKHACYSLTKKLYPGGGKHPSISVVRYIVLQRTRVKRVGKGASYWIHGNAPLPYNMSYGAQSWYYPTVIYSRLDDSSELNSVGGEGSGPGGLHVIN